MTATDWLEVATGALSNSLAAFAITVTIASGYLVASYLIGSKLVSSQIWIVNTLFIFVMSTMAFADLESLKTAVQARNEANLLLPHWRITSIEANMVASYFSASLNFLLVVGCLKFMWDIRHDKD